MSHLLDQINPLNEKIKDDVFMKKKKILKFEHRIRAIDEVLKNPEKLLFERWYHLGPLRGRWSGLLDLLGKISMEPEPYLKNVVSQLMNSDEIQSLIASGIWNLKELASDLSIWSLLFEGSDEKIWDLLLYYNSTLWDFLNRVRELYKYLYESGIEKRFTSITSNTKLKVKLLNKSFLFAEAAFYQ